MNIFRLKQKLFSSFQASFNGLKGRIARTRLGKRSDSYKNFGPWKVIICDEAMDDYETLDLKDRDIADNIFEEIETKPYQGSYGQHPLWEFYDKDHLNVIWSAEINDKDRITYVISTTLNVITVTNVGGHMVLDMQYAVRPKL